MPAIDVELPGGPDAPGQAREAIRDALGAYLGEDERFELELLVTELVTNAVRHAPVEHGQAIELTIERREDAVRIEVLDHGPGFVPVPRADPNARASGWGLNILARVADRWGVENDHGARVWFEIETPGDPKRSGESERERDGAAA